MDDSPLAPLRTRLAPPPPPQQPMPRLFVLAIGGKGLGKAECVGSVAQFVRSGAAGWVTMRLVSVALRSRGGDAALRVGDELQWRRSALREILPNNKVAAEPPTMEELLVAAAPTVAPLAPPPLPPLMPTLLGELSAAVARVVVLFDLEGTAEDGGITEMAATAVYVLADGTWGVPPAGRFGTHVNRATSFSAAASDLNAFLERMSAGAGGVPLTVLAHNGRLYDWRILSIALGKIGASMASCVAVLGCTRHLFVAEQAAALGAKWSMKSVYAARFGGAKIPNAHQALGDVSAMERILVHAISVNGTKWALKELDAAVRRAEPPAAFVERYAAQIAVQQQAPVVVQAAEAATPAPPQKADPLECDEFAKLRTACGAAFGVVPESRGELMRALRSAAELQAALRAAAPALERAARADRLRLSVMICTSLLSGLELLCPALERALDA